MNTCGMKAERDSILKDDGCQQEEGSRDRGGTGEEEQTRTKHNTYMKVTEIT